MAEIQAGMKHVNFLPNSIDQNSLLVTFGNNLDPDQV